jgi:hypothetical protein
MAGFSFDSKSSNSAFLSAGIFPADSIAALVFSMCSSVMSEEDRSASGAFAFTLRIRPRTAVIVNDGDSKFSFCENETATFRRRAAGVVRKLNAKALIALKSFGTGTRVGLSRNSINPRVRYFSSIAVVIIMAMMAVVLSRAIISGARVII